MARKRKPTTPKPDTPPLVITRCEWVDPNEQPGPGWTTLYQSPRREVSEAEAGKLYHESLAEIDPTILLEDFVQLGGNDIAAFCNLHPRRIAEVISGLKRRQASAQPAPVPVTAPPAPVTAPPARKKRRVGAPELKDRDDLFEEAVAFIVRGGGLDLDRDGQPGWGEKKRITDYVLAVAQRHRWKCGDKSAGRIADDAMDAHLASLANGPKRSE